MTNLSVNFYKMSPSKKNDKGKLFSDDDKK